MNWRRSASIIFQIAGLTIFFWLYHKFAGYVITDLGIKLGVITPQTAPLYADLRTDLSLWIIPAVAVLASCIVIFRIFFERRKVPAYILLAISILLIILIDTTVAMMDGGLKAVVEPYTRTANEYYGDVPKVQGIREFLRDYVNMFDNLSGHSRTHPPGGALFLWLVSKIFGTGLYQAAFSTIVFTSLAVIPVYLLAKELYGENVAKYAMCLFMIAPNMVMFTATAMDGPFSFFPILSVYLFYKALSGRTVLYSMLTGFALGFGMLMNYTTIVISVFFVVVTIVTFFARREKFRNSIIALSIAGGTFVLFYLFLYLWARYNLLSALWMSYKKDESGMGTGYETPGRYFHISVANLFAFLIGVGIPLTTIWLHEIVAALRSMIRHRATDVYVLGCFLTIIGISFSSLFTLEVERLWIFMVPFVVIPVSKHLYEKHRPWEFYTVAALTCFQLLLAEMFLYTYW